MNPTIVRILNLFSSARSCHQHIRDDIALLMELHDEPDAREVLVRDILAGWERFQILVGDRTAALPI